jgi:hypothetical protein
VKIIWLILYYFNGFLKRNDVDLERIGYLLIKLGKYGFGIWLAVWLWLFVYCYWLLLLILLFAILILSFIKLISVIL